MPAQIYLKAIGTAKGRFKAIVMADEYLKHLSRYIHLNPVRAGMVKYCKDYPWSSYRVYGGYAKAPEWMETNWLLSLFSANLEKGKERYRGFIESVENEKIERDCKLKRQINRIKKTIINN